MYRAKLVKQRSTVSKHANQIFPLLHSAPGLERAPNTNLILFGSTPFSLESTFYHTPDKNTNHYTTDVVVYNIVVLLFVLIKDTLVIFPTGICWALTVTMDTNEFPLTFWWCFTLCIDGFSYLYILIVDISCNMVLTTKPNMLFQIPSFWYV
jgi:hypothetical protein